MKIGIDIDDTLNKLSESWIEWIVAHYDSQFSKEKWRSWDLPSHAQGGDRLFDFLQMEGTFSNLSIRSDAQRVTKRIAEKHDIYTISAFGSVHHGLVEKGEWLAKHFPHIPVKNYMFCNSKGLVGVDVLIDDGPHNFDGFKGTPIVMDKPWNTSAQITHRAKNWNDIESIFEAEGWL